MLVVVGSHHVESFSSRLAVGMAWALGRGFPIASRRWALSGDAHGLPGDGLGEEVAEMRTTGVGEELGDGESCDGVVGALREIHEAVDGVFGVVLGGELELLLNEGGAELAVGLKFAGGEEGFGFFFGEIGGGEDVIELGIGVGESIAEMLEGFAFVGGGGGIVPWVNANCLFINSK